MIYTSYIPNSIDLSEKFADFLMHDTVANMKSAFSLMGRRFIGQPRKQQVANGIAKYVREHPLDVLHKCESDTLMYIKKMVEMGKGSNIIIGEPDIYHLQIQKMELVLTYFNKKNNQTELYLLDELHDIFAPHIDEAYKKPSEVLQKDMVKYLEEITFKVQLDNTPIYRTFKVIDRCSMFELNMLIQFCFNWNEMHPHAFKMERDGHWEILTPHTRLSKLLLDEGEQLHFLYDTKGDKWEHTLTVEAIDDYDGKEDDYEPKCIAGFGPDPGEGAGGNAWVRRNLPYIMKNKKKYYTFSKAEINDSFHFWWLEERHWWIEDGIIKYDD